MVIDVEPAIVPQVVCKGDKLLNLWLDATTSFNVLEML